MKRSRLTRKSPIKRKAILQSKRFTLRRLVVDLAALAPRHPRPSRTSYARRDRYFGYMGWIATLPCLLSGAWPCVSTVQRTPCGGRVEVDHAGDRGLGQRSRDSETIPLCTNHHGQRTDLRGAFVYFDKMMMKSFRKGAIRAVQRHAFNAGIGVPDDGGRCSLYVRLVAQKVKAA